MSKQTPKKRVLFVRRSSPVILAVLGVLSLLVANIHTPKTAYAAAANTVNFQARLQTASGAIVPDGNYNVEFSIYDAVSGGTKLWHEDYLNANSQGLQTVNGYLSANLGSITAFSGINWDQQLWLTMNIGGTVTTGTFPTIGDGEMDPRLSLTAVPAAFSAQQLASTNSSNRSTLTLQGSTHGNQDFVIQDQGAAGTYNLLTKNQADISYIQNGTGLQASSNFNISGSGVADTLQGNTAIKTPAIRPVTDSTTALQVQNAAGTVNVMTVDTTNSRVGFGTGAPGATVDIKGATADDSTIALNVANSAGGALITARNDGQVTIGTTATSGTSTDFGSKVTTTADSGNDSNFFAGSKFTTGSNPGTLTSISIYVNSIDPTPANDKFRLAIYTDNAGKPDTRVAQSGEGTLSPNTFNSLPVSASLTANTSYWLVYQTNGSGAGYNDFSYSSAAAGTYYAYANPYGPFPTNADRSSSTGAIALAIYGTYTEAGSSTTPAVVIAANGNVGIGGVTTPSNALQVQGTVAASALSLTGNGTATAFQAGLFDTASGNTLNIGTSNATSVNIGHSALISTVTISNGSTGGTFINYASTLNPAASLGNYSSSGAIGTAASTVDIHTSFTITQTTSSIALTIPSPTNTTAGRIIYIANTGSASVTVGGVVMGAGTSASFFWNGTAWISTAVSTGVSVIGTYSSSSIANGASISGNTLTLGVADGTNPGMVSTTTQTFAGNKTLTGNTTMTGTATVADTSSTAFRIQNTGGGTTLLTADTSGNTVTINGALTTTTVTTTGLTNNGQTTYGTLALGNFSGGGSIGSASTTVDIYTSISVAQTSGSQTLTIPSPTASTAYGKLLYLSNVGTQAFTLLGTPLKAGATATLIWSNTSGAASWQYAGSDGNSILNQSSSTQTADFNISGTGTAGTFTASTFSAPNNLALQAGSGNNSVNITATGTGTVKLETGAAAGSITLGSSNLTRTITIGSTGTQAQTITIGDNTSGSSSVTTIQGSDGITLQTNKSTAGVTVKSATNSTAAFQIQNTSSVNLFAVDTSGNIVNIGSTGSTALASTINIATSSSSSNVQATNIGSNGDTSNTLTLDAGTGASAIQIGNSNSNHGIKIGTGTGVQTVALGSGNSSSTTTIQGGTGGVIVQTGTAASGNSGAILIQSGNASSGTAGNVSIDVGTGTVATGSSIVSDTFESGVSNWESWYGTGAVSSSTAQAHGGTHSLAFTTTSSWGVIRDVNYPGAAATPGTSYTFTAWVRSGVSEKITLTAAWVGVGSVNVSAVTVTANTWTKITGSLVAPVGTTNVYPTIAGEGSSSHTVYVDDVTMGTASSSPLLALGSANAAAVLLGNLNEAGTTTIQGGASGIFLASTSTTALTVQDSSGNSYFNIDTTTGNIVVGNSASGNYIAFSASGGLVASGTAQHSKAITLSAEYAGAVLDSTQDTPCQSSNNGTMTSAYDGSTNYYKWVSNASAQCYDVVVRVPIPSDWASWSSTSPITVNAFTTNTSTSLVNLQVLKASDNTAETSCNYVNVTPSSSSTWSTSNSSNCVLASTTTGYSAGGTMTLRLRMTGNASSDIRIDGINLNYNSKF